MQPSPQVLEEARAIIAGFLKNRRKELNLTQQDLADRTGLGLSTIQRAEDAKFWLNMKQYLIICSALHLFPAIAEMESETELAHELRANWKPNPKTMTIEQALAKKREAGFD